MVRCRTQNFRGNRRWIDGCERVDPKYKERRGVSEARVLAEAETVRSETFNLGRPILVSRSTLDEMQRRDFI